MNPNNQFTYFYENIGLYQFGTDWIIFLVFVILGIGLMIAAFYGMQMAAFYNMHFHADQAIRKKKRTLGDLILMKDIQTELENEIEQAILKAAFHT